MLDDGEEVKESGPPKRVAVIDEVPPGDIGETKETILTGITTNKEPEEA